MIQLQFLNYILKTKDSSVITHNNITVDYFSNYKAEFTFIMNHFEQYGNIPDVETFAYNFPNFEWQEVTETPAYLLKTLFDDYNTRRLAEGFNKVRTSLINNKADEAIKLYQNLSDTLNTGVALTSVDILKDTTRYNDYLERTENFGKYYIATGFKELDNVIGGFDKEEELATIVARTNIGKSWVLLKCAVSAAKQGLNVGLYSGEMSERKVGYRIDTLIGHVNNGAITHGNINVKESYKKYLDDLPSKVSGSIKVLTPKMINGPATVNSLRAFIEKENLDILFVDQLSLLEDQRNGKSAVDKMSNISKDLKNLQVLKRVPIVSVCQQNRTTTESGNVDTTQIAQSDRIGQDSTMIIFLEKKDDTLKFTLVKSRDTENGKKLTYRVDFNKGIFDYVPDKDEEEVRIKAEENAATYYSKDEEDKQVDEKEEVDY